MFHKDSTANLRQPLKRQSQKNTKSLKCSCTPWLKVVHFVGYALDENSFQRCRMSLKQEKIGSFELDCKIHLFVIGTEKAVFQRSM